MTLSLNPTTRQYKASTKLTQSVLEGSLKVYVHYFGHRHSHTIVGYGGETLSDLTLFDTGDQTLSP